MSSFDVEPKPGRYGSRFGICVPTRARIECSITNQSYNFPGEE